MMPWEKAINLLEQAGFEAYLVGGCVRDMLLGREAYDFDLCTSAKPEEMKEVFHEYKTLEVGIKHGTLLVMLEGSALEITTYRMESGYEDKRHPNAVSFTEKLSEDLKRRDFTVNAMAYHPQRGLVDLFGGQEDLDAGLLRCVGVAEERFREDALRILRGLRFASQLGFSIQEDTLLGMKREKRGLSSLSKERIRGELEKFLLGDKLKLVIPVYLDILTEIFPEIEDFEKNSWGRILGEIMEKLPTVPLLRWTAFFYHLGGDGEEIMGRLSFAKWEKKEMTLLLGELDKPLVGERKSIRRKLWLLGADSFFHLLALKKALGNCEDCGKIGEIEELTRVILAENDCFRLDKLAIKGEDLVKLAYEGKNIGLCLQEILLSVMDEQVANDKGEILAYLKRKREEEKEALTF